jgi:uncharacterized phage protein gp47/JayE
MTDTLDQNGLQITALNDIITDLEATWKSIYGNDINLDSNTPDGQLLNIIAQMRVDNSEICASVYNSFDLTKATGSVLDIRVAYIGIVRTAGTYTEIPVNVTVDRVTTLQGLDANYNSSSVSSADAFTVSDGSNQAYLATSATLPIGTTTCYFRAADIGNVSFSTNTVTTQVTPVVGVTAVNNPNAAINEGKDEETDSELRLRAQRSYGINSSGYLNGLEAKLLALTDITEAKAYENYTNATDSNGIPAHSIWVITEGGANADIANAIYKSKCPGTGMKGSVTYDITATNGTVFTAKWDTTSPEALYIRFDLKAITSGTVFDLTAIKSYMETNLTFKLGEYADTSKVTASALNAIQSQTGYGVPLNVEISLDGSTWGDYFTPSALNKEFNVSATNITITEV